MAKDSLYANDQDIKEENHMVTLSTCYGSAGTDRRLLIQGREVAVEQVQEAVPDAFYKKKTMRQRGK
jgi:sortase (surface protein transpeptidase)